MPRRGVIYLVSGPKSYLSELSTSLTSLRRHDPDLAVTVFSRYELPKRARCEHVLYDNEHHPLQQKVLVFAESPYEQTLFIDTDTTILGPIAPVFDRLADANIALAHSPLLDTAHEPPRLVALENPAEYNTGVVLYDDSAVAAAFLQRWRDAVMHQDPSDMWAGHNCDQTHFNRLVTAGAVGETGVALGTLPNVVWNVRGQMVDEMTRRRLWSDARIFHHRTRHMKLRKALSTITDIEQVRAAAHKGAAKVRRRILHST
ncbi:MAG: hypothetical protein ACRDV7_11860 [Acidimicrobiia bacterium]